MEEKIKLLKQAIIEELPQIPFIIDQVGEAIDWCIDGHEEGEVIKTLEASVAVAKYIKSISEPNFYKTQYVIVSLIGDIPNALEDERFSKFRTTSNIVEKVLKAVRIDSDLVEKRGCFNALNIHMTKLAREDEVGFVTALYGILYDLKDAINGAKEAGVKKPITPQDYVTILGYAYVMSNLRMAGLKLLDKTQVVMNEIQILLNNEVIY